MIPSARFYLLLLLNGAIAATLATFINQQLGLQITLLLDAALLILSLIDAQVARRNRAQIKRAPLYRLSIGRDNPVSLSIAAGQKPAKLLVRDNYPTDFAVSKSSLEAVLPPNSSQNLIYNVHPDRRGEYNWGDIQARQIGPWGLAWHDWKIPQGEKVAVYPDLVGLRSLSLRLTLESTGTMRQARRLGTGTEFSELREYNTGDDIRFVDWKATARRSQPLIRVLEPEREQTLIVLLDRGRLMTSEVQGLKRFDWAINATLSLALAGLNRGDRVGVGVFDRTVATWIPPQQGQHQLSMFLERLTAIQPVLLEPDYLGAVTKLVSQQTRRALVVLLTDIVDATASAELLAAMGRLAPRYLPFCVALRDPQVDEIAHTSAIDIDGAYERAVALDLLSQRRVAFAQLKQRGVLVLDAPANQISQELVDRYLQLKRRSLL